MAGASAGGRPGSVRSKTKAASLARLLNRDCIRLLELYRERESFLLEESLDKDRIINLTLNASHLSANERVWLLHSALHQCLRLLECVIGWEDDQGFGGAGEYKRMRTTVKDRLGHLLQSTKSLLVETEGITPPPPEPDNPETDCLKGSDTFQGKVWTQRVLQELIYWTQSAAQTLLSLQSGREGERGRATARKGKRDKGGMQS